jgi:hypothetical protein
VAVVGEVAGDTLDVGPPLCVPVVTRLHGDDRDTHT